MKKLILAAFALTTAASVFAQGTIYLQNRVIGSPINQTTHVYAPLSATDTMRIVGLGANDLPVGTTDFGGRVLIGASGVAGQYGASTTFGQLVMALGTGQSEASLLAVGAVSTFRSGTGAGFINQVTSTINSVGGTPIGPDYAGPMTFSVAAWDNSTGLYPTWTEASVAWQAGEIAAGMMTPFSMSALGGLTPIPVLTQNGANLTSFNLYFIPEPSSFALAGLGAAALLIFRRRK